jgi:hypothetical protein
MKLHLRVLKIDQKEVHLITLRPEADAKFWIAYHHPVWWMCTGYKETNLLARLLWGLSYQKQPNTMILIDRPHIQDIAPEIPKAISPPLLILPTNLSSVSDTLLQGLKSQLKQAKTPTKTIRWRTFGLDIAQENEDMAEELRGEPSKDKDKYFYAQSFVCYTAPPHILRHRAYRLYTPKIPNTPKKPNTPTYSDFYQSVSDYEMTHPTDSKYIEGEIHIHQHREQAKQTALAMTSCYQKI